MNVVLQYFANVGRWLDIGVNTLVLFGSPNESVSERAAKARDAKKKWGCVFCYIIDILLHRPHCDNVLKTQIGDHAILPDPTQPPSP